MSPDAEAIARTVLYEGYLLYPYRASAIKNRHRWSPGALAPRGRDSVQSTLQAECLVVGGPDSVLTVRARFLHPFQRIGGNASSVSEATEREVEVPGTMLRDLATARRTSFGFPTERGRDGERLQHAVNGAVEVSASRLTPLVFRVTARVENLTLADHADVELRSLTSAHVVLHVRDGEFVSLTDPPENLRPHAEACHNLGVWPVLVGAPGSRDTLLASPIILPDFPRIAPESTGDYFDSTEIDEMLALRVLTLTDAEKREMVSDPHSRAILDRVEAHSESAIRRLHGAVSGPVSPRAGDRVRIRPRGRADALDVLLAGKLATVVSVEVDFEDTTYLAVTMDDDPGRDLGAAGMPGHRFFFRPDEVEPA
jgi:hypothetical protein